MATSMARPTANRALHLRITPRPSNLGESREILRLLSGFGEIEYFKNLKYDTLTHPNIALIIFKEEQAAINCKKKAPIRFRMGKAPVGENDTYNNGSLSKESPSDHSNVWQEPIEGSRPPPAQNPPSSSAPFGLGHVRAMSTASYPRTIPDPPPRALVHPYEPLKPTILEHRLFQIIISTARANFRDLINVGQYHGSFPLDSKSIAQRNLQHLVPAPGMSCVNWRAETRPWRVMQEEKAEEGKVKTLWQLHEEGPEGKATFRGGWLPG